MRRSLILALVTLSFASAEDLAPEALEKLLDQIEESLASIESIRADFVQIRRLSLFEEEVESKGVCLFQSPDRLRFEIVAPYRSVLVARGDQVAKYEHMRDRWRKLSLADPDAFLMVTSQIAGFMRGRFRENAELYAISARLEPAPTVVLVPHSEALRERIASIEVALDAEIRAIREVRILEPGGDATFLRFTGELRGTDFDPGLFDPTRETPLPLP